MARRVKKELKPFPIIKLIILALISNKDQSSTIACRVLLQDDSITNFKTEGYSIAVGEVGPINDSWSPVTLKLKSTAMPEMRKNGDDLIYFLRGHQKSNDNKAVRYKTIPIVTRKILWMLRTIVKRINCTECQNVELLI